MAPAGDVGQTAAPEDLKVLDGLASRVFGDVALLARIACETPMAAVNFAGSDRQWTRVARGVREEQVPRLRSFCARAVRDPSQLLVMADVVEDPGWASDPDVAGFSAIHHYAAGVILDETGRAVGTVTVLDHLTRELSAGRREALTALARQAGQHLCSRALCLRVARVGEQLRRSWSHDELTDLATRGRLREALSEALVDSRSERVGLIYCDLDGFKQVNDRYGHRCGDELLRVVGRRLISAARGGDLAARLGGDEFVMLCCGVNGPDDLDAIATRIETRLAAPARVGQLTLHPAASVGMALAEPGESPDAILHRADESMFARKRTHAPRRLCPSGRPGRLRVVADRDGP